MHASASEVLGDDLSHRVVEETDGRAERDVDHVDVFGEGAEHSGDDLQAPGKFVSFELVRSGGTHNIVR